MGFFGNSTASAAPAALSSARVQAGLTDLEWRFQVDEDGDIHGGWDEGFFYFLLIGEDHDTLNVRGQWYKRLPVERLAEASAFTEEWNRSRIWPKVYPLVHEPSGTLGIVGEQIVCYAEGVTDEQLKLHLGHAVAFGNQLFEELEKTFPDAISPE